MGQDVASCVSIGRRDVLLAGCAMLTCGVTGCDTETRKKASDAVTTAVTRAVANAGDTIADAVIVIGELVLKIPHVVGKVVGVILISGGAALKVYVANLEGKEVEVELKLTPEQILQIQKAIHSGKSATVTQPDGETTTLGIRAE